MALAPSITINLPGYPFENFPSVATVSDLRALASAEFSTGDNYVVDGGSTEGDGGGGVFAWNDASTATDDGATVIKPNDTSSGQAGRWILTGSDFTVDSIAQILSDLASTASGKGAALVAFKQLGTGAADSNVQTELRRHLYVDQFGAAGDGTTNDTTAFVNGLARAAATGAILKGSPGKTYSISTVTVADGVGGMDFRDCTIKGRGGTTNTGAIIVLGSDGAGVTDAEFHLRMDMSAGDLNAVLGYDTKRCKFTDCDISGFTNSATYNHYGIWLIGDVQDCTIKDNRIVGYDTPTMRGNLISVTGEGITAYGGFFTGTIVRATTPAKRIIITDNHLINGSYAVILQGVEDSQVNDNVCDDQNHRNIYMANACWRVVIDGNILKEGLSSGVVLSYGCGKCVVTNNEIQTTTINGEAGVNVNTGSCDNYIACNKIDGPFNYGVYVATDSLRNTVHGNEIENVYLAHIAMDNDWISPRPSLAIFARPNYGPPTDLDPSFDRWSFHDLAGTVITDNIIKQGYTGRNTAAISISQIDAGDGADSGTYTGIGETTITGNKVVSGTNVAYDLAIYTDDVSEVAAKVVYRDNVTRADNSSLIRDPSGTVAVNQFLKEHANNGILGRTLESEVITFTDADTTPSVSTNCLNRNYGFANTGATSVTDFDDAFEGQIIRIRMDGNTTLVHNNSLMRLQGATNVSGRTSNDFITFVSRGGVWFELTRRW